MHYRTISDMNDVITANIHRLPSEIDLVVGVPRSGYLAANLFCLIKNIPMTDLDSFIDGRVHTSGITRRWAGLERTFSDFKNVLVIDDSIRSGASMRLVRERINASGFQGNVMYSAVFGSRREHTETDFIFSAVPEPRVFQWNVMHHSFLESSCVDIDGVLCLDPTEAENDDGPAYEKFLLNAVPLHKPTRKIGSLVTSRLEKYRGLTEEWLGRQGIAYDNLIMLDLPSQAERRRLGVHGSFKAEVYRASKACLFIESEREQAEVIARMSGKPALCISTQEMFSPDNISAAALYQRVRSAPQRFEGWASRARSGVFGVAKKVLGPTNYKKLRSKLLKSSGQ